jgi:hypothetical protein
MEYDLARLVRTQFLMLLETNFELLSSSNRVESYILIVAHDLTAFLLSLYFVAGLGKTPITWQVGRTPFKASRVSNHIYEERLPHVTKRIKKERESRERKERKIVDVRYEICIIISKS